MLIEQAQPAVLDAGDVLFFHCKTLHAATRNHTEQTKYSVVFTFRGADNPPRAESRSAESPELLNGFLTIRAMLYGGTFTPAAVQVLALTNAFENGCDYCIAFHSALALKEGVSKDTVTALRAGRSPREPELRALSEFSRALVTRRTVTPDSEANASPKRAPTRSPPSLLSVWEFTFASAKMRSIMAGVRPSRARRSGSLMARESMPREAPPDRPGICYAAL